MNPEEPILERAYHRDGLDTSQRFRYKTDGSLNSRMIAAAAAAAQVSSYTAGWHRETLYADVWVRFRPITESLTVSVILPSSGGSVSGASR